MVEVGAEEAVELPGPEHEVKGDVRRGLEVQVDRGEDREVSRVKPQLADDWGSRGGDTAGNGPADFGVEGRNEAETLGPGEGGHGGPHTAGGDVCGVGGEGILHLLGEGLLLQGDVPGKGPEGTGVCEDGGGLEFLKGQLQPELRGMQKAGGGGEESIGRCGGSLGLLVGGEVRLVLLGWLGSSKLRWWGRRLLWEGRVGMELGGIREGAGWRMSRARGGARAGGAGVAVWVGSRGGPVTHGVGLRGIRPGIGGIGRRGWGRWSSVAVGGAPGWVFRGSPGSLGGEEVFGLGRGDVDGVGRLHVRPGGLAGLVPRCTLVVQLLLGLVHELCPFRDVDRVRGPGQANHQWNFPHRWHSTLGRQEVS